TSLAHVFYTLLRRGEVGMGNLGVFGEMVVEELRDAGGLGMAQAKGAKDGAPMAGMAPPGPAGPGFGGVGGLAGGFRGGAGRGGGMALGKAEGGDRGLAADKPGEQQGAGQAPPDAGKEPVVRKNFADTAYWASALTTDQGGVAEVGLTMPENLTGWKVKAWALGHGTKVGEGAAEVTTKKDLLVRLQAPRFFVQKDEVVLSANVHNYLQKDKAETVTLELS